MTVGAPQRRAEADADGAEHDCGEAGEFGARLRGQRSAGARGATSEADLEADFGGGAQGAGIRTAGPACRSEGDKRSVDGCQQRVAVGDRQQRLRLPIERGDSAVPDCCEEDAEEQDEGGETAPAVADATPARAAAPMADGETSLVRALGLKIGRIVIDAGHGGHDSGTLGVDGIQEKDVVLDVALRLGKLLHDRLGAEIIYTRSDDTFIPLETRTAIANKAQADLFHLDPCKLVAGRERARRGDLLPELHVGPDGAGCGGARERGERPVDPSAERPGEEDCAEGQDRREPRVCRRMWRVRCTRA